MNLARLLYPVTVLGPGNRVGLWVAGCSRRCPGCSNPELWLQREEYEASVETVEALIRKIAQTRKIDGFTVSGGEPMEQGRSLSSLFSALQDISTDILVYTGYEFAELSSSKSPEAQSLLQCASVVIAGPYIEELNNNALLRGSSNQSIHILKEEHSALYQKYLCTSKNQIQNFSTTDGIVSVGIHRKTFQEVLK